MKCFVACLAGVVAGSVAGQNLVAENGLVILNSGANEALNMVGRAVVQAPYVSVASSSSKASFLTGVVRLEDSPSLNRGRQEKAPRRAPSETATWTNLDENATWTNAE